MGNTFSFAVWNSYQGNRKPYAGALSLTFGTRPRPVFIAMQEARRHDRELKKVKGYTLYSDPFTNGLDRAQDLAILFRDDINVLVHYTVQVTKGTRGDKFGHERYVQIAYFTIPGISGVWLLINSHMNAVVQSGDGTLRKHVRARRWRRHMKWIERFVKAQPAATRLRTIVTMDANFKSTGARNHYSPHKTFERLGMVWRYNNIDGYALNKQHEAEHYLVDTIVTGGDHKAIVAKVRVKVP